MPVLMVLAFLPLRFLIYWMWRVRRRRDPLRTVSAPPAASIPTALLLLVIAVNASALAAQPSAQVVTLFNTRRYAEAKTALLLTAN